MENDKAREANKREESMAMETQELEPEVLLAQETLDLTLHILAWAMNTGFRSQVLKNVMKDNWQIVARDAKALIILQLLNDNMEFVCNFAPQSTSFQDQFLEHQL